MIIVCPTHNAAGLYNLFIYSENFIANSSGRKIERGLLVNSVINTIKRR